MYRAFPLSRAKTILMREKEVATMIDNIDNVIDLNALLHPGSVFEHPRDVLRDTNLATAEKRAILASWASDAAAVASNPALREWPGARRVVSIDEVLEALTELDGGPQGPPGGKTMRMKSTSRVGDSATCPHRSVVKNGGLQSISCRDRWSLHQSHRIALSG
jgi:hypothetical protein